MRDDKIITFGGEPCRIISDDEREEYLPNSHRLAVIEDESGDIYTVRGKKGVGLFAVKRRTI